MIGWLVGIQQFMKSMVVNTAYSELWLISFDKVYQVLDSARRRFVCSPRYLRTESEILIRNAVSFESLCWLGELGRPPHKSVFLNGFFTINGHFTINGFKV